MTHTGTIAPLPVPYQRMTREGRFTARAKRYHASQARVALLLRATLKRAVRGPYRLRVLVYVRPVASGPNKGGFPGNRGDVDNYAKSVADALQFGKIVEGDDMRHMRGISADVALTDGQERLEWALEEIG